MMEFRWRWAGNAATYAESPQFYAAWWLDSEYDFRSPDNDNVSLPLAMREE